MDQADSLSADQALAAATPPAKIFENGNRMVKIQVYCCLTIEALDIDAIRIDKSIQVTLNALSSWSVHTRARAAYKYS